MNIWNVLGITATEDKNEIKKAYRNKLRQINPEDEQEKFMELRDAYEQALNYEQKEIERVRKMLTKAFDEIENS